MTPLAPGMCFSNEPGIYISRQVRRPAGGLLPHDRGRAEIVHRRRRRVIDRPFGLEMIVDRAGPRDVRRRMRRLDVRRLLGSRSPSHFATTADATALPTTLVAERPMSRKWSTARISSSPASGILNMRHGRGDHHQAGARHAGHALRRDHQHQQHGDFLADGQVDAIGLGDEDRREGHVHHRAVEIERIAERQDEAGDARRHAETVERLQGARDRRPRSTRSRRRARSGRGCSGPGARMRGPTMTKRRRPAAPRGGPGQDRSCRRTCRR